MKSNIKKGIVFFLVGLMIMQVIFSVTKKDALAYHTENAKLVFLPMELYATNTRADSSLPAPFKNRVYRKQLAIGIQDAGKNHYEPSYCIGYEKLANTNDKLYSKESATTGLMTNENARLVNYAIMLGFNRKSISTVGLTREDRDSYFATQLAVWIAKEGFFYKDAERTKIENFMIEKFPTIKNDYYAIYTKVKQQDSTPSIFNGAVNELKWNEKTGLYEVTLTNTVASAMNNVKVVESSLPQGVKVTISGDKLTITSTTEFTSVKAIKFTKNLGVKGRVVAWKNTTGDKQNQVTIDFDQDPIA